MTLEHGWDYESRRPVIEFGLAQFELAVVLGPECREERRTELEKTNMDESDWPHAYTVVEKNSTVLKMLWMLGNEPQLRVLLTRSSNPALKQALRSFETLPQIVLETKVIASRDSD
jgi:hypothetical protein